METEAWGAAAAKFPPDAVLSREQSAFFHENGFLALDRIMLPEEVDWMRSIYDQLFADRAGRGEGNQLDLSGANEQNKEAKLPQILSPAKYAPELANGQFRVKELTVARQLLGLEAEPRGDHAIFKPAGLGAATPWHQDGAYWNPDLDYQSMSIWTPHAGPNTSNIPRRAFIAGFGLPAVPRTRTPRRFLWNEIKQTAREARRKTAEDAKA